MRISGSSAKGRSSFVERMSIGQELFRADAFRVDSFFERWL